MAVDTATPLPFAEWLRTVVERHHLDAGQMRAFMQALMSGSCDEAEAAGLLIALRMKGETSEEIAAAARVLREHMVAVSTTRADLLDTSGTGGDGASTFNISTAAAFVAAGAGVPVVKHGNRAVSSRSGSADVLAELGVAVAADAAWPHRCLEVAGMAFCFAPHFHPAMKRVAPLRQRLGIRTLFNSLGPLLNPAGAVYQLMGIGKPELLDPIAGAMAQLGTRRAFLVWGKDGVDEVSMTGPTVVREVRHGRVQAHEWHPADFGLEPCTLDELRADGVQHSAAIICQVLDGTPGPARRVVLANAAAALLASERVQTLREGVESAEAALNSGKARLVMERLRELTAEHAPHTGS